jgi:FMN phosphatase YigB (HAD superfamily)
MVFHCAVLYIYYVKEIKNIIFDLGGVLLPVDYQAVINAFTKLGIQDAVHFYSQKEQQPLFDKIERGEISGGEFIFELKKIIPSATEEELTYAWNVILGLFPQSRLKMLEKIKKHYRVFLLSNTNEMHIKKVLGDLKEHNSVEDFISYFDEVYYSYETGFRKPEKEIYDLVLLENSLNASETLFIEDTEANVLGAVAAGIPTVWLKVKQGETIESVFTDEGKLNNGINIIYPHQQ